MLSYRRFKRALDEVGFTGKNRVLVHVNTEFIQLLQGGNETLLAALLDGSEYVITPAFTPQTMIIPRVGPENNAITYSRNDQVNEQAEFFHRDLPANIQHHPFGEFMRHHTRATRSAHPIFSFCGIDAGWLQEDHDIDDPYTPISRLADDDGDILLLGVDHSANFSLHMAAHLSGRRMFTRWALTAEGAVTCELFPGCSHAFPEIEPHLHGIARYCEVEDMQIEMIPVRDLIHTATSWLRQAPQALLCRQTDCRFCATLLKELPALG